jgi:hypothetical protein
VHRHCGIGRQLVIEAFDQCGAQRINVITDTAESFYASLPHRHYAGFRIYSSSAHPAAEGESR